MPPKGAAPRNGPRPRKEGQKGDFYRIAGVDVPYDPALNLGQPKPTPLFPDYKTTPPEPLTEAEQIEVDLMLKFREKIHDGPFYTVLGDKVRDKKPGEKPDKPAATFNAFEGMPKYSQRYSKPKRTIPKMDTRPYIKEHFPKELWSTVDPNYISSGDEDDDEEDEEDDPNLTLDEQWNKYKTDHADLYASLRKDLDETLSGADDEAAGPVDEDAKPTAAKNKDDLDADGDDPMGEEEEVDDEYADDEEDGDDYNAEQYFDDGEGEGMEDDGAGGDEGARGWYE